MPHKNVISYNTMVGAYSRDENMNEAWALFSEMRILGFSPTQFTFGSLLSCDSLKAEQGFCLQALAIKSGLLYADAFVGTALLNLFGREGCLGEAHQVFDEMPFKNVVTWNAMISLFGHQGYADECMLMFCELMRTQVRLSEYSFVGVLRGFQSEEDLQSGEQIHGLSIKFGFDCKVQVANSLVNLYGKCASIYIAEKMFDMVLKRDIISWNTIIGVLAISDEPEKAIEFCCKMHMDGFLPNSTTFLSAIASCTRLNNLPYGEFIHAKVIKKRFEAGVRVGSSLVNLYAKCGILDDAHRCFEEIRQKNLICWNALLIGYSNRGGSTSILLLREMIWFDIRPNEYSFSSVIKSISTIELKQLHSLVVKMGYHLNEYVTSSLMTSYAKNGLTADALTLTSIEDADINMPLSVVHSNVIAGLYNKSGQYHKTQELFCAVDDPDIVSWNILIAACARNGDHNEAFELFQHMQMDQIPPDNYTYVSLLSVCTKLCNLALGSSLHGLMTKADFNRCDAMVCNVMIDMYGKCGSLESSVKLFDEMKEKNVISWTTLVSALGHHGHGHEALERFREMKVFGIEPDRMAFRAALSACRHGGLVKEGLELFEQMKEEYGIQPQMDHYLLTVDLMARYGHLKEAEQLISSMPLPPNASIWRSFLDGCKRQRIIEHVSPGIPAC